MVSYDNANPTNSSRPHCRRQHITKFDATHREFTSTRLASKPKTSSSFSAPPNSLLLALQPAAFFSYPRYKKCLKLVGNKKLRSRGREAKAERPSPEKPRGEGREEEALEARAEMRRGGYFHFRQRRQSNMRVIRHRRAKGCKGPCPRDDAINTCRSRRAARRRRRAPG